MTNKKIFELIKKGGQAIISRSGRVQWVSDGIGAYSLAGLPEFSGTELMRMCDIGENTTFPVTEVEKLHVLAEDGREYEANISELTIKKGSREYVMITYNDTETFFVQMKYIKDYLKDYNCIFTVRCEEDCRWLCIKDGAFLCACIMPSEIVTGCFSNDLYTLASGADRQLKKAIPNEAGIPVKPEMNILGRPQGRYRETRYEQEEL